MQVKNEDSQLTSLPTSSVAQSQPRQSTNTLLMSPVAGHNQAKQLISLLTSSVTKINQLFADEYGSRGHDQGKLVN